MHGQHHTPNHPWDDLDSIGWLLRARNRLRAVGGQSPSDLRRKKAFWIAICIWGVGAASLWWLGRPYVSEASEALFAGVGFVVGIFYIFALGPIAEFIEQRIQHLPYS